MEDTLTRITVPAELGSLGPVTEFARKGAREARMPEPEVGKVELAIEEAVVNVARYAYPPGQLGSVEVGYAVPIPGELILEISDKGYAFDPLAAEAPDLDQQLRDRPIGGLGIFLIKSFAKSVTYRRDGSFNRLFVHFESPFLDPEAH